ncbi:MAG: ABC transporter substrate-binding protein [Candidatus Thermoplasmatota archaeon]|nr:ABC transporter substrate-binding protein [Candidatus Thermoplasmatota archaeon]
MKSKSITMAMVIFVTVVMLALGFASVMNTPQSGNGGNVSSTVATGNNISQGGTVYINTGPTPAFVENFNPFDPYSPPAGITSLFYEPLFQINPLNGTVLPWLATGYSWSSNNTLLTINIRHNVTFSNGMPLNSTDVKFTFDLQMKSLAEWSAISSIYTSGNYTVKFQFKTANIPYFFYVGSNFVLPEPLWKNVTKPASQVVKDPIGTGPYLVSSFSSQKITLTRNPNYWQPNEPHLNSIVYIDYTSGGSATLAVAKGLVQWAPLFVPNITSTFTSKDPAYNHYFFPPTQPVTLLTNDLISPLNHSFFRQALSLAINRSSISISGEYGYEKPSNAANILQQQLFWLNKTNLNNANLLATYNVTLAKDILKDHNYNITNNRLYYPNGTKIPAMTLMTVAGYTDWDADVAIIASDLADIGLKINIETPTNSEVSTDVASGNFTLAQYVFAGSGPNPWYDYSGLIGNVTKIGQTATLNDERWNSTGTGFMSAYNNFSVTSSSSGQNASVNKMVSIMLNQMPVIPLVYSADWYEYVNKTVGGFPNANNDYWVPVPWAPNSMEVVALHLYGKSVSSTPLTYSYTEIGGIVAAIAIIGGITYYIGSYRKKKKDE